MGKNFEAFYKNWANKTKKFGLRGINPNPYDVRHQYDYGKAYEAGARPTPKQHWPSQFKMKGHPTQFQKGDKGWYDSITGIPLDDYTRTSSWYQTLSNWMKKPKHSQYGLY